MFQTLTARPRSSGNSEYVVQPSEPPFEKTKRRPSCLNCRQKKLRCIYKDESCVKCLKQRLRCVPGEASTTNTNGASNFLSSLHGSDHDDTSVEDGDSSSGFDFGMAASDSAFTEAFKFPDLPDAATLDDRLLLLIEPPALSCNADDGAASTAATGLQHSTSTVNPCHVNWQVNTIDGRQPSPAATPFLHSDTLSNETTRSDGRDAKPVESPCSRCSCLHGIMSANETLQVKLIWGSGTQTGPTVSVDDMLQCQKGILASCESFLHCHQCNVRSDYVILVLSMCREMIGNMSSLDILTASGSRGHASAKEHCSNTKDSSKSALTAGGWRLDDAIEVRIMKCLLGVRITRLNSLISHLEKLINAHHRAYGWIVRDLKLALNEKLDTLGHMGKKYLEM